MGTTKQDVVVAAYLTFPDEATASTVSNELVKRRLAACCNVFAAGSSVYWWEGEVVEAGEVFAVAKTTAARVPQLVEAMNELHPYELPAAVSYRADGGSDAYLEWVRGEVAVLEGGT